MSITQAKIPLYRSVSRNIKWRNIQ